MELTVLGCAGGVGRAGEACSGYLVREGGTQVLLDCGSGVVANLQRVCPLEDVDHVVISHWHADHSSDAGVLVHGRIIGRLLGRTDRELAFYAPPCEPDLARVGDPAQGCRSQAVVPGDVLHVGDLKLEFCQTRHPVPCHAVRVTSDASGEVLVYTADGALTDELALFCRGAHTLVCECSLYAGTDGTGPGHMNADDVAQLALQARPLRMVLTHLPCYGERDELLGPVRRRWEGCSVLAREMAVWRVGAL